MDKDAFELVFAIGVFLIFLVIAVIKIAYHLLYSLAKGLDDEKMSAYQKTVIQMKSEGKGYSERLRYLTGEEGLPNGIAKQILLDAEEMQE